MASAVNQTIVYSIVDGNEGGEYTQSCLCTERCCRGFHLCGLGLHSCLGGAVAKVWVIKL